MKEQTEWHNIVCWRNLAEIAEKYVKKGTQLFIEGRIRTRSYNDKDGNTKYMTEILADNMQLLAPREEATSRVAGSSPTSPSSRADGSSLSRTEAGSRVEISSSTAGLSPSSPNSLRGTIPPRRTTLLLTLQLIPMAVQKKETTSRSRIELPIVVTHCHNEEIS